MSLLCNMIRYRSCFVIIMALPLLTSLGYSHNEGRDLYCDPQGPPIRFPFHLIQTNSTDHSGFGVSCSNNTIILHLPIVPVTVKLKLWNIDYESQRISVGDPNNCLPRLFLKIYNSIVSPFRFDSLDPEIDPIYPANITFFDCSSIGSGHRRIEETFSQNMISCPIYAIGSDESVVWYDLVSCTKMFDIVSPMPSSFLQYSTLTLAWSEPKCDAQYFDCKPTKIPTAAILSSAGSISLLLLLVAFFLIYRYFRMKGEDQARVENFLEDYRALKPTRLSYADIKRITNQFRDQLGEGAHGAVFKGKLSNDIQVAVKILNNADQGDGKDFVNEVGTMGKIHHVNVVRLLGFCADGFHRALVYNFFSNGSLQKFIYPPDNNNFLGWGKLQQIAIGIAKGIEYLHQGCDHRILHFDINPRNVLLDDDFTPKIIDFGLAKLCSKNQSTVSMTAARGTLGYMAPEVFSRNFGNVSYKSDIYSYGMLLLEMVGGRKNVDNSSKETFQLMYPDWIHNLLEGRDIHIHIDDEESTKIAKKLALVGLWCIQWYPINRPSMKIVLQMLEGEIDKLKIPPNPFESSTSTNTSAITSTKYLNFELEVIHESE